MQNNIEGANLFKKNLKLFHIKTLVANDFKGISLLNMNKLTFVSVPNREKCVSMNWIELKSLKTSIEKNDQLRCSTKRTTSVLYRKFSSFQQIFEFIFDISFVILSGLKLCSTIIKNPMKWWVTYNFRYIQNQIESHSKMNWTHLRIFM